jgi:tRNA-splicing ligase RtcB
LSPLAETAIIALVSEAAIDIRQVGPACFEIPPSGGMRVPARIYATPALMEQIRKDRSLEQAANVAHMPGIERYSLAMPDIHWGYGFPIGGVAAFDMETGVISPGGVGYDINCGVRLLRSDIDAASVEKSALRELVRGLFGLVPSGTGDGGVPVEAREFREKLLLEGARWAVARGFGEERDLARIEEHGRMAGAETDRVSERALQRGRGEVGSLGSGNHFLEIDRVDEIYDEKAAKILGLERGKVAVIIHTGSRGFGHQICTEFIHVMEPAMRRYGISLPDRQLCCAPLASPEGRAYLGAMRCAVNFAFANRQVIAAKVREAFARALGRKIEDLGMETVYEVAHNIAKIEEHEVSPGVRKKVCVHRKGATRAFPPEHPALPPEYRAIGQPVLIPGDMGRYSFVLVGCEGSMRESFGSTCHGAGRLMSRTQAAKIAPKGGERALEDRYGTVIKGASRATVAEEIPEAYKDVAAVVDAVELAGLSRKVARLRPLGVLKG